MQLAGELLTSEAEHLLGAEELFFHLARPDLVVADHGFAGVAVAREVEAVVLADLDALAFGLARDEGRPLTLVPCNDGQAPAAYEVLGALARRVASGERSAPPAGPAGPSNGFEPPGVG